MARSTGLPYDPDPAAVEAVHALLSTDPDAAGSTDDGEPAPESLFGPPVPMPDDAPLLDRAIGLAGRDPGWAPA